MKSSNSLITENKFSKIKCVIKIAYPLGSLFKKKEKKSCKEWSYNVIHFYDCVLKLIPGHLLSPLVWLIIFHKQFKETRFNV